MLMGATPLYISFQLQPILTASFNSFVRQRSCGCTSSQERSNDTHQNGFRKRKDI